MLAEPNSGMYQISEMRQGFMLEIKRPAPIVLPRHICLKLGDTQYCNKRGMGST